MAAKARVKVPGTVAAGEVFKIKALISHEMESGHRKDAAGNLVPRKIINKFTCAFNGVTVFACDLHTAVSANPYFEFNARIEESGTFTFSWLDDDGARHTLDQKIDVT